jgi:hypothetical protein
VYVLQQLLDTAGPGTSDIGLASLGAGELLTLAAPFAFFAAIAGHDGRWRNGRRWIAPVILALLFSAGNVADTIFNQGFTGVFTTWSLGLNLIWPWPIYSVALALFAYSVLTALSRDGSDAGYANPNTGVGLILLLFAGFTLQIPYQHLLALLSLLLLTGLFQPIEARVQSEQLAINQAPTTIQP